MRPIDSYSPAFVFYFLSALVLLGILLITMTTQHLHVITCSSPWLSGAPSNTSTTASTLKSSLQSTPAGFNGDPVAPKWLLTYKRIYDTETERLRTSAQLNAVVYSFNDNTGWGNRMRAQYFAFFIGVFTGRLVAVSHVDYERHFDDPVWNGQRFKLDWWSRRQLMLDSGKGDGDLGYYSSNFDGHCSHFHKWEAKNDDDYFNLIPSAILQHNEGNAPDIALWNEKRHRERIVRVFGTSSRYQLIGQISEFFMSSPNDRLLNAVHTLKEKLRWSEYQNHSAIQFRSFTDYGPSHDEALRFFPSFMAQSAKIIDDKFRHLPDGHRVLIFWTTDDSELNARAKEELFKILPASRFDFATSPYAPQHTSRMGGEIKPPIVEWFLLGEADHLISTGTTYGQMAAARVGFRKDFWSWVKPDLVKQPSLHAECGEDQCL